MTRKICVALLMIASMTVTPAQGEVGVNKDGVLNGQGTMKYANGDEYTGNWADGKMQGQGTMKWADGNEYTGTWADGKRQGQGTEKAPNGNEYTGTWADDNMQGQGTLKWSTGEYTGTFADNKRQGQGTERNANGNQYTGTFADNKRQGQGTLKWANGTRFEGEWRDNKPFSGTEISPNGTRVEIANGEVVKSPQQVAAAPPAATGLPLSSGMVGETPAVSLSPPGNARSRNECVKLTWATSPLPLTKMEKQREERSRSALYQADYFGAYPAMDRAEQRALVATSVCEEDLVVVVFTCIEDRMLVTGSHSSNVSWVAGEHSATGFTGTFGENLVTSDPTSINWSDVEIARELVIESRKKHGVRRQVEKIFYGAWLRSDITSVKSNGPRNHVNLTPFFSEYESARKRNLTSNGMSLARKIDAVTLKATKVVGGAKRNIDGYTHIGAPDSSGGSVVGWLAPTAVWRKLGVQTCPAFTAEEIWNATQ